MRTQSIKEIRDAVRAKYAWPGGYPLYLVMNDGASVCIDCARKNWKEIARWTRYPERFNQWKAVGAEVNWESQDLECAHCYKQIESAYGGDE